jgi:hypothetical protein
VTTLTPKVPLHKNWLCLLAFRGSAGPSKSSNFFTPFSLCNTKHKLGPDFKYTICFSNVSGSYKKNKKTLNIQIWMNEYMKLEDKYTKICMLINKCEYVSSTETLQFSSVVKHLSPLICLYIFFSHFWFCQLQAFTKLLKWTGVSLFVLFSYQNILHLLS